MQQLITNSEQRIGNLEKLIIKRMSSDLCPEETRKRLKGALVYLKSGRMI